MRVSVGVIILVLCAFSSCRDRVVCPAYQSTYILDDSVRQTYYSYLWRLPEEERQNFLAKEKAKDSIPGETSRTPSAEYFAYVEEYKVPEKELKKNDYGIIKYQPWWVKQASLRTAPKINVYTPVFEEEFEDEGTFVAGDFAVRDSLGNVTDSTAVSIPKSLQSDSLKNKGTKYLYDYKLDDQHNMEQVYYNKYFGEYLVDRAGMARRDSLRKKAAAAAALPDSLDTGKKKKKGFMKGLFKKKKTESDSTSVDPVLLEEDSDEASTEEEEEDEGGN